MSPVSKQRAAKRKASKEFFEDGLGVRFHETRLWLPSRVSDWPKVRIVNNKRAREVLLRHQLYECGCPWCSLCESYAEQMDGHHIFGGSRGRSDELTNLLIVCRQCHERIQSDPTTLPEVLHAKWEHDRESVSWVRLTLLAGRWLDDLELGPRK